MTKSDKEQLLNKLSDIEESILDLKTGLINLSETARDLLKEMNNVANEIEDIEITESEE